MENITFTVQWPGKLVFGAGRLAMLEDEAKTLGRHAFLATTRDLSALGVTSRVKALLEDAGLVVTLHEDVRPDPTCNAVDEAAAMARASGCDLAIGLGGGSAIDLAKGVAVAVTHPGPIWDYVTCTGFSPDSVALYEDVRLIRQTVGPEMGIKASGRVGTYFRFITMLEAGATRIGLVLEQAREILRGWEAAQLKWRETPCTSTN